MFCENCGTQVGEGYRFCPSCGKSFSVAVMRRPIQTRSRVQEHVQLVATLWIAVGVLQLLISIGIVTVSRVIVGTILRPDMGIPGNVFPLLHTIFGFVSLFIAVKGAADVLAGWGLLERATWARPLAIVVSFLALLNIPIGTALGIYSLWVLLPEDSARDYDRLAQAA